MIGNYFCRTCTGNTKEASSIIQVRDTSGHLFFLVVSIFFGKKHEWYAINQNYPDITSKVVLFLACFLNLSQYLKLNSPKFFRCPFVQKLVPQPNPWPRSWSRRQTKRQDFDPGCYGCWLWLGEMILKWQRVHRFWQDRY